MPRFIGVREWNLGAKTGFIWAGACFLLLVWTYFRLPGKSSLASNPPVCAYQINKLTKSMIKQNPKTELMASWTSSSSTVSVPASSAPPRSTNSPATTPISSNWRAATTATAKRSRLRLCRSNDLDTGHACCWRLFTICTTILIRMNKCITCFIWTSSNMAMC